MSEDDVLFIIKESNLDSGLRGVPVGTCETSYVDPLEGVHYVGYPVEDLVNLEEEDVVYLLLNKELPTPEQSEKFRSELAMRGETLPTGALRVRRASPPRPSPPAEPPPPARHAIAIISAIIATARRT